MLLIDKSLLKLIANRVFLVFAKLALLPPAVP